VIVAQSSGGHSGPCGKFIQFCAISMTRAVQNAAPGFPPNKAGFRERRMLRFSTDPDVCLHGLIGGARATVLKEERIARPRRTRSGPWFNRLVKSPGQGEINCLRSAKINRPGLGLFPAIPSQSARQCPCASASDRRNKFARREGNAPKDHKAEIRQACTTSGTSLVSKHRTPTSPLKTVGAVIESSRGCFSILRGFFGR